MKRVWKLALMSFEDGGKTPEDRLFAKRSLLSVSSRERQTTRHEGAPVYLSVDIDVLDPSVAPGQTVTTSQCMGVSFLFAGTGTPEFGGLLAHQLLQFIRG